MVDNLDRLYKQKEKEGRNQRSARGNKRERG
jgi:hypothetical protein